MTSPLVIFGVVTSIVLAHAHRASFSFPGGLWGFWKSRRPTVRVAKALLAVSIIAPILGASFLTPVGMAVTTVTLFTAHLAAMLYASFK